MCGGRAHSARGESDAIGGGGCTGCRRLGGTGAVDQRIVGCDYSDVAVLGKGVTRGPAWRATGLAIHVLNGALFGLAFHEARQRVPVGSRKLAVGMALTEHVALYPLCFFIDRFHPARGEPGVPPLLTNGRAFAQATWRHALFGAVLGRLA